MKLTVETNFTGAPADSVTLMWRRPAGVAMPACRAHHFGVTVSDLDHAVEFYRDVLGLDVLDRFTVSGSAFAEGVGVPGATGRFAHLDAGGARVELVEYSPEGPDTDAGSVAVNQPGATHLGLSVEDIDAVYAALPEDVETTSEPRTTESGTRICFVRDPDGNLVELLEP